MQRLLRHLFIKSLAIIFILTSSFLVSGTALADTAVDVQNIGFEDGGTDAPLFWDVNSWENNGRAFTDSSIKHSGQKSVCIQNDKPTDTRCRQSVQVKPNTVYKISCWVKTQDVGPDKKGANISVAEITDTSKDIHGTNTGWENISLYGRTGSDQNKITVTVGLGGYGSLNSGKAWFDDVSVTEVSSVPGGENIVSLFMNSQSDNASSTGTNNGNTSNNMILILLAAVFVFIVGVGIILVCGSNKPKQVMSGEDADKVIVKNNDIDLKSYKIGKYDIMIMAAMTLVYLVVALINLGGTNVPQTPWKPTKVNESFIVDLGKKQDVKRISYYDALGDGWYASGNYIVQYLDETGNYKLIGNLEKKDVFTWKYIDVNISTERLKFIVEKPGGTLNEIGIFGKDRNTPLKVNIIDKNQEKEDDGKIENLFDEQKFAQFSPSYMTSTYFDEIYHARTAYEFIHHITPYENTHPPLGKVFIS
ncbi:MAG TPA: phospholipid carrier-dependent glycosyltransferase, partial [Clostridia bacterium]